MNKPLIISTAPHLVTNQDTKSIMKDVIIALVPAALVGILFFGINALAVIITAVAGCVVTEHLICKHLLKIEDTTTDYSAVITGILLAFNLPSSMPLWMVLVGCVVSIGIAKMCFGGLGRNLFNPALIGRVFLFISFPVQMTIWPNPNMADFLNADVQTGATTLAIMKQGLGDKLPDYTHLLVGYHGGCIGEISVIALLIGFAYLLYRRIITWHIPFYYIATVFLITAIVWLNTDDLRFEPVNHILSGGLMLGAIFMATDYTTSPMGKKGKIIFAVGCGILTAIIRLSGSYPEGVSFAILIMNAFVPLIDKLAAPRVFGKGRK